MLLGMIAALLAGGNAIGQISPFLPFEMPGTAALRKSPKKVFAHYFTPFPIAVGNVEESVDYYTKNFLNPQGESGKFLGSGGFLRERPLARSVRTEANWAELDLQTEVRRAIDIGLDGFTIDLLGTTGKAFERTKMMLAAANAVDPGFKIVLMPDMMAIKSDDENVLAENIQTLAAFPAAYRLDDGRLVVAPYNAHQKPVVWWQSWLKNPLPGWRVLYVQWPWLPRMLPPGILTEKYRARSSPVRAATTALVMTASSGFRRPARPWRICPCRKRTCSATAPWR